MKGGAQTLTGKRLIGDINSQINAQKATVQDMQKRQAQLQTRLDLIQRNYFTQYSNLNSLLFQLSSTSNSLSSALTALTNMSASK
jgi:flagellar capping protein FliD